VSDVCVREGGRVLMVIARWCFGLARIWRMSILITWLCRRAKLVRMDQELAG
jgi:hypothetical protein